MPHRSLYLRGLLGLLHKGRNHAIQQLQQGVHWSQAHINEEIPPIATPVDVPAYEEHSEEESELDFEEY